MDVCVLTCITLLLRPVMSASFCSVWASGLLSWANWACIICRFRQNISIKSNVAWHTVMKGNVVISCHSNMVNRLHFYKISCKLTFVLVCNWCNVCVWPVAALQWRMSVLFWPVWVDCLALLVLLLLTWYHCLKNVLYVNLKQPQMG